MRIRYFTQTLIRSLIVLFLFLVIGLISISSGLTKTLAAYTPPTSNRVDISLNTNTWKFIRSDVTGAETPTFDDSSWTAITLPHTWNNLDGEDGGNNYYRGIGWYRSHYTISSTYTGRKYFLQFDGASIVADVYINGTHLGQHQGAFATFRYEITPYVTVGSDNVIAVKVNNAYNADVPPLSADFTFFGGLYRGVHLLMTDQLALKVLDYASPGVYLKQTNVSSSSANLQVTAEVYNSNIVTKNTTVTATIVDASGNVVTTLTSTQSIATKTGVNFVQSTTIANPHLWNGLPDPYLYTVYVQVQDGTTVTDLVSQPLGFRFYRVDPNQGFFLNGNYLDLHGVDKHQDRQDKGWAISNADIDQDMALIKEIGATAIRLSHYQHAQRLYDDADQQGLVLWSEIPLINNITNSTAFTNNTQQQLIELIRQNYNHPSILFWGIANEVTLDAGPDPNPLLTTLNTLAHTEDPTRPTTIASEASDTDATNWHTDLTDFNKYFGWYYGAYTDFGGWADNIHANNPSKDIGISEYGAGSSINFHSLTPTEGDHTEEYQNLFHESTWQQMASRHYLWSKFIWNMFDFAADARNEGDHAGRNDKGLMTYDRQTKKDVFYYYKANWSTTPVVYITSRRFTPRTSTTTDIKIYSNADSVQLLVNGNSLGSKTSTNHIYIWKSITLANGTNNIQAIGTLGGTTYNDNCTWVVGAAGDGSPFGGTAPNIPGKVEAENYNTGGEGVAYHDSDTTNSGGQYRTSDGVDIQATTDTGGGYDVGWSAAGEWMKYTVNVTASGSYKFDFRVASNTTGGTFHLEVDNTNVTGSLTVPNTGGWQVWTDITTNAISLTAGQHIFKWVTDVAGMNFNWFTVSSAGGATATPTFVPATSTPTPTSSSGGINSSVWYEVVNQGNGKCVDDANGGTANGNVIQQWACFAGSNNQEWQFQPTSGGYYKVISKNATGSVWDIAGPSTANGALLHLWTYGGGANQQWLPVALDSTHYKFVNQFSGTCLDVPSASTTDGVQLDQFTCNGTPAQSWSLSQQP